MAWENMTPEECEAFLQIASQVVENEHRQMTKVCPRCGGRMSFKLQELVGEPVPGDRLTYECEACGEKVQRFFPFPENYAKYFK